MKQITFKLIASLLVTMLVFGTTACKKDNDNEPEPEPTTSIITLTVDGTDYEPFLIQNTDNDLWLYIVGSFSDGQHSLSLVFDPDFAVGTYDLSDIESTYGIYWDKVINLYAGDIDRYFSDSGTLVIEEYDPETGKLKGTFNAICKTLDNKSVTITNGTFIVFL